MKLLTAELITALDGIDQTIYDRVREIVRIAKLSHKQFFFVGNGGSAAIASHMAADWMKNGNMKAMCFNDGAALTCLGNDLGYERTFSVPVHRFGTSGDVLFAISSSGQSQNIIEAASTARKLNMCVVTLTGFKASNPVRLIGSFNFYVPSNKYGVVEISHLAILHSLLDEVIADAAPP
jgi:D-sedoheptulose 7-phosphate isomerase